MHYLIDENGNLIVRGLDSGYEYRFRIEGYKDMPMEKLLTKDDQMSAKMGFPVYVLPEKYSDKTEPDYSNKEISRW